MGRLWQAAAVRVRPRTYSPASDASALAMSALSLRVKQCLPLRGGACQLWYWCGARDRDVLGGRIIGSL
jgi:hypothetical protein